MTERAHFRIKTSRITNRNTGRRETFKIAVTVPQRRRGPGDGQDPAEHALDNAEKIFENLVQSGRLPRKK